MENILASGPTDTAVKPQLALLFHGHIFTHIFRWYFFSDIFYWYFFDFTEIIRSKKYVRVFTYNIFLLEYMGGSKQISPVIDTPSCTLMSTKISVCEAKIIASTFSTFYIYMDLVLKI